MEIVRQKLRKIFILNLININEGFEKVANDAYNNYGNKVGMDLEEEKEEFESGCCGKKKVKKKKKKNEKK